MQQVLSENYYCVFGWMREMGLKGLPLQIYAIIYGFCQAKGNAFYGSLSYLEEFTGYSRPSVIAAIKQLIDEGFIDKEQEEYNQFIVRNKYICKKFPQDEKFNQQLKDLTGVVKNLHGGSKETLPNNKIIYNKIDNIEYKESKKEKAKPQNSFDEIFKDYTQNEETLRLLGEWLKVRKSKRAAMTDYSIKLNLNKLDKLAKQSNLSVNNYLKEVIARGWQAFYPVKSYETDNNGQLNETYSKYRRL